MYSKSNKMIMIALVVIIIVGSAFVTIRYNTYWNRPSFHLNPYPSSTEGLSSVTTHENIEIKILRTRIHTFDPHWGPTTMDCSIKIEVTNIGLDVIDDLEPFMGTVFTLEHNPIYSFWIAFYGPGVPIEIDPIPTNTSVELLCGDIGSLILSDSAFELLPESAYIRFQMSFSNVTLTLTTPPAPIMHALE